MTGLQPPCAGTRSCGDSAAALRRLGEKHAVLPGSGTSIEHLEGTMTKHVVGSVLVALALVAAERATAQTTEAARWTGAQGVSVSPSVIAHVGGAVNRRIDPDRPLQPPAIAP